MAGIKSRRGKPPAHGIPKAPKAKLPVGLAPLELPEDHVIRPAKSRRDMHGEPVEVVVADKDYDHPGGSGNLGGEVEQGGPSTGPVGRFARIDLGAPPAIVENAAPNEQLMPGQPGVESTPAKLTKAQRRVEAFNLRVAGHDYRVIAETLGVSVKTAYYDVQEALKYLSKYERVLAEDYKAMQLSRLDAMMAALWPGVEQGDTFKIQTALQVMGRQSKLLGLDAPVEIDLNVKRPLREASLTEMMDLVRRLGSVREIPGSVVPGSAEVIIEGQVLPGGKVAASVDHFTEDEAPDTDDADDDAEDGE